MRARFLALILLTSTAAPALLETAEAQPRDTVERRVDRLEQQLRAVQRRVFPNGNVEPEVTPQGPAQPGAAPGGDAMTSLIQRVDALETQLRTLTNDVEEANNRSRRAETDIAAIRAELAAMQVRNAATREAGEPFREPAAEPAAEPVAEPRAEAPPARPPAPAVPASAEEAYNAGYRLWDQRRFAEAQVALEAAAARYPTGRWNSWTRNLLGRAYLDDGKPATAARILLANYQENQQGERAADSLFYLGQALTQLNRRAEACRVYDELARVYPNAREQIQSQLPQARRAARCTAG